MTSNIVILGAAGRDFHVFNCCYRDNADVRVAAFTATQIPYIDDRAYPPILAGPRYPDGIPIRKEDELLEILQHEAADEVVFSYSDVSHRYVDERRRLVESAGVRFAVFDVDATMLTAGKPVIAVCATRTGCGKSQTSRRIAKLLLQQNKHVVAVRHPMPYGDLAQQVVQRFASRDDLDRHDCTVEEREEYEPFLRNGVTVYAGVDYAAILAQAEQEADVIIWDGGNNDTPFYKPDLWITVVDPHRAGDEIDYFPGDVNFRRADILLINKIDSASERDIALVEANAKRENPAATIVRAESRLVIPDAAAIAGKRVLAIEDGPTTTHGGMAFGAAVLAARRHGAQALVNPKQHAVGELAATFARYPDIGPLLPAMGYGEQQLHDLEATINATDCDLVLIATPVDLARLIRIDHPHQQRRYRLAEQGSALADAVTGVA